MANRINFVLFVILIFLSIITTIIREIYDGEFTIHTQKLLILILPCLLNFFFSYYKKHLLTIVSIIFLPPLIIVFLPVFLGYVQQSDYLYTPLIIVGSSIVPQIILEPRLSNKIYLLSLLYFFVQILTYDNIFGYFSTNKLDYLIHEPQSRIYYKLIVSIVFVFIHSVIYYLRSLNLNFELVLSEQNEELKTSNDELYKQREEIQNSLNKLHETQNQLVQSEKMASLGVLAAGIAHEINNPLNFIHGGVQYIESYIQDNFPERFEELQPVIEGINTGVKRSTDIVNSINNYSRKDVSAFDNCSINKIIDDCLIILHSQYKHRITVQKGYAENQYEFTGNEGKLRQAFLNILSNAIHAITDKGEIFISTSIKRKVLCIEISDNGHGISQENLKNIFDPFFTTKPPGEGTGLGLAITYSIIQEHNGTIDYESQIGEGTKVLIKLPLIK